MEARLLEVQKRLGWLCLASLVLALAIRPQPQNRRYVDALAELESFRAGFVRKQAEAVLQKQAEGRGEFSFALVQEAASKKRGPKLKLGEGLSAPRALSFVRLATLADAHAYAEPGASLPVGVADAEALGHALAWRMGASAGATSFTLKSFELLPADVSEEDVAADLRVGELRNESLLAKVALDDAGRKLEIAERRVEKRQKRRSKSLSQFVEIRDHARGVLSQKTERHAAAVAKYEQAAKQAERSYKHKTGHGALPKAALARIVLASKGEQTFEIPVRLRQRRVSVPVLRGAEFSAVRAAGLWDELATLDAEQAIEAIEGHFNWHLRSVKILGMSLSGSKVLSLLPCALVALLLLLFVQIRRAETSYSPFSTKVPSSLPRVGFKQRWLELVAIVVLPLVPMVSAAVSLWQINQLPVLPALSALTCLALGGVVFVKLSDLRNQTISIVRSHSYPPPAHDLSLRLP